MFVIIRTAEYKRLTERVTALEGDLAILRASTKVTTFDGWTASRDSVSEVVELILRFLQLKIKHHSPQTERISLEKIKETRS